jgi:ribosomal protein L37E
MRLDKALTIEALPGNRVKATFRANIQKGKRNTLRNMLEYCYICERENWGPAVASNTCAWCGWDNNSKRHRHEN